MLQPDQIIAAIDNAVEAAHNEPPRGYIGASIMGKICYRQIWYAFRWVHFEKFQGRMLRLFNRGHEEEDRFVRFLRQAGAEVQDYQKRLDYDEGTDRYFLAEWGEFPFFTDVSTDAGHIRRAKDRGIDPKQWEFEDFGGHFGGHTDGRISWKGVLPDEWGLLECKTHNDASFKNLTNKKVQSAKIEHYVQMQIYMHYMKLPWALYFAVNKNDDSLYMEIVYYRKDYVLQLLNIAQNIILSRQAPPRYTSDPSWFVCKFCSFRDICHYDHQPLKNCRSCAYAQVGDHEWICNNYQQPIPADFIPAGCSQWVPVK